MRPRHFNPQEGQRLSVPESLQINEPRIPNGSRTSSVPSLAIPEPQGPKTIHLTLVGFTRMLWLPREGAYILPHD